MSVLIDQFLRKKVTFAEGQTVTCINKGSHDQHRYSFQTGIEQQQIKWHFFF